MADKAGACLGPREAWVHHKLLSYHTHSLFFFCSWCLLMPREAWVHQKVLSYRASTPILLLQVVPVASASMMSSETLAAQQAAEAAEYKRLQAELQAWCQGTALAGLLAALLFYSKVRSWQPLPLRAIL